MLYLGVAIDRFGKRSLALHYALGIVFIGLIALSMFPYLALLAIVVLSGLTVIGSQTGLNAAVENSIRRECARPATVLRNGVG